MFKDVFLAIIESLRKVGIGWTLFVLFLTLLIIGIFNYKTIILDGIEIYEKVRLEKHEQDMKIRDELLDELDPLLREFRASSGADRLLYFEYHNSKENLVGIPFKYVDLVLAERDYGIPGVSSTRYKDINAGLITDLYKDLISKDFVINSGDSGDFESKYSGVSDFLGQEDGTRQQLYINIPGVNSPVGIIILEWIEYNGERDWVKIKTVSSKFIPRVNALIINKSDK